MKINIIKKVLMLETNVELEKVLNFVSECMSREYDQDEQERVEFKKWKKAKENGKTNEITF
tara:strand:- start:55 stop:237 length:183 start_codon:yes stop_codon:yes gene_type:complete